MSNNGMKELFEKEYYKYMGEEKVGAKKKYVYECPNGHKGSIRKDHWVNGHRCSECAGNIKLTIEYIKTEMLKEGYTLVTTNYKNSSQILNTLCPYKHEYKVSWNNWSQGYRCSTCSGRAKKTIDEIQEDVLLEGYKLSSKYYLNNKDKISLICPNNHKYEVSWDNWKNKKSRCPRCNGIGVSKQENELFHYVKQFCNDAYASDRTLIAPYELDIVIPSKKIAIEYCGLYWHSELMGKNNKYHLNKKKLCSNIGYNLITIFEDEFVTNKEITLSRLKSVLKVGFSNRFYARNCEINAIPVGVARNFCIENHLQGYGAGSSIWLGAFCKNVLVGVMTFSKPSLSKGCRNVKKGTWELNRFCTKINYHVVGLCSKILTHFKNNYEYTEIFYFADSRWSIGNLYEKIGFRFLYTTKPNYWYFNNNKKRIHRFALRKRNDESKDVTEWDLRRSQGWNRIWDFGNLKYILEKESINTNHLN